MQVVLVNPPFRYQSTRMQPLGLSYIGAILEADGHQVSIIDLDLYRNSIQESSKLILQSVSDYKKTIVGFSTNVGNWQPAINIAQAIKRKSPSTVIVVGGYHATLHHREILQNYPFISYVIRGEGEITMKELCAAIHVERQCEAVDGISFRTVTGTIQENKNRILIEDLDSLPFPARHLLPPLTEYRDQNNDTICVGSLVSSRGCPYGCSFCSIRKFYSECAGPRWRGRSPTNIVDEIEELLELGVQRLIFVDDLFLFNADHVIGICKEILAREITLKFQLSSRSDSIIRNRETIPLLKQIGCDTIEIGVESGSDEVLKRYKKQTSVADNIKAIEIVKKSGIIVSLNLIMFDPYTSMDNLRDNLQFLERVGMYPRHVLRTFLLPIPGTDIHDRLLEDELVTPNAEYDLFSPSQVSYFKESNVNLLFRYIWRIHNQYEPILMELDTTVLPILTALKHRLEILRNTDSISLEKIESLEARIFVVQHHIKKLPYISLSRLVLDAANDVKSTELQYAIDDVERDTYVNLDELISRLKSLLEKAKATLKR